jgi:hypothetical protein
LKSQDSEKEMKAILLSFICIFLAVTRAEVALASPEEGHLGHHDRHGRDGQMKNRNILT